jgi:hypothetical protein
MAIRKSKRSRSITNTQNFIADLGSDRRKTGILAGIVVIVVIASIYLYSPQQSGGETTSTSTYFEELLENVTGRWTFMEVPDRISYPIPTEVFDALPPMPSDFGEIDYMLEKGRFFAIGKLGEEYYKQPEFYPRFEEFFSYWTDPNLQTWGTNGYGTYPADQWTDVTPGTSFTAYTFFHTSWNIETWQGVKLVTVFPTESSDEFHNKLPASEVGKYFDVEISPDVFLIDPTFPIFGYDWAHKVTVNVQVAPNTPPGQYVVGVSLVKPPAEYSEEWAWEHKNFYFDAASSIGISRPQLRLMVTVH